MTDSKSKFRTVEDYIASFPNEVQVVLETIRKTIKEVAPEGEEKISYNLPAFTLNGVSLLYFSAWKTHTSLYPYTSDMEKSFPETSEYKTSGKGTIQFPLNKPLPILLIKKIVEYRIKEIAK